ncbi:MAG: AAA family ATPase [Candidatus Dormibacteraeota bacterium]|nr:AAA family ATPase [Candidatus Dormibacteraeota bacterium]
MRVCAKCGRENPGDATFCNGCGSPLAEVAPSREQRKTVTILFCDVTGSTSLGERTDPESFQRILRRYFEVARDVVERHGGTVEKFIGDAVMAVFGVPVLHEDDALRAVRAAIDLRDSLVTLNDELQRDYGVTLSLRMGLNTGRVVTDTGERLATGDAVNVAARLEQVAAPGEIILGQETLRTVRSSSLSVERLQPLELKGKQHPVIAYRLQGLAAATDAEAHDAAFVGRAHELRLLRDAFAHTLEQQSATLFTLLGTAGVGKTRLVAEFLRDLDATVLEGRCLSYGEGITYFPVVSMLKQLREPAADHGVDELLSRDKSIATAVNVLLGHEVAATTPNDIFWALRKLIEHVARRRPVVLVFDDLHWAESNLYDLIEHMTDFSREAPILILCVARPELLERRPGWGGGKLDASTVLLQPLDVTQSSALINELLDRDEAIPLEMRERILASAGGNPLFIMEILAMAAESRSPEVAIPPTIHALMAARLDQLRQPERRVLERGSVEGQSFHAGAVELLMADEEDIPSTLMVLVRKDLIRPDKPSISGENAFRFRHILIRDAAYDALPKAERADLHERFAGWLLQHATELIEVDALVGYHLEQAFRYRSELGPVSDAVQTRLGAAGSRHLGQAGDTALQRGDVSAAVKLFERAVALHPGNQPELDVEQGLINGLGLSGRVTEAVARAAGLAKRCAQAGNSLGELRAELMEGYWGAKIEPEKYIASLQTVIDSARPVIEVSGDDAALASLWHAIGFLHHYGCRYADGFSALNRALEHAQRANDVRAQREILHLLAGAVALGPTPIPEALAWFEDRQRESQLYEVLFDVWRASLMACRGQLDEARALASSTRRLRLERGLAIDAAASMQEAQRIERLAGDPAAAERLARHGCEELLSMGERSWMSTLACQLADALYALRRFDDAQHWATQGLDAGGSADVATQMLGCSVLAKLAARRGDRESARRLASQAAEIARGTQAPVQTGDVTMALAEVLWLGGDSSGAQETLQRAIALYEVKGASAYVAQARAFAAEW